MLVTACCTATSAWCIAACCAPSMPQNLDPFGSGRKSCK
jgi:hypothetical protein